MKVSHWSETFSHSKCMKIYWACWNTPNRCHNSGKNDQTRSILKSSKILILFYNRYEFHKDQANNKGVMLFLIFMYHHGNQGDLPEMPTVCHQPHIESCWAHIISNSKPVNQVEWKSTLSVSGVFSSKSDDQLRTCRYDALYRCLYLTMIIL